MGRGRIREGADVGRMRVTLGRWLIVGPYAHLTLPFSVTLLLLVPLALALAITLPSLLSSQDPSNSTASVIAHASFLVLFAILTVLLLISTSTSDPGVLLRASDSSIITTEPDEQHQQQPHSSVFLTPARDDGTREKLWVQINNSSCEYMRPFCVECGIYRPVRAHHCSVCNVCVREYDHHCPYLATCVGSRNRTTFILFTAAGAIASILLFAFALRAVLTEGGVVSLVLTVYGAMFGCTVGLLATTHLFMATCLDVTTDEFHDVYVHRFPRNYPPNERRCARLLWIPIPSELSTAAGKYSVLRRDYAALPPDVVSGERATSRIVESPATQPV